jgi:Arc/MetJ-type ribon-helix-helix transcriptional regulator
MERQVRGARLAAACYRDRMTITLTPEQQKRLEAAVAAGQFSSLEEAVRFAVDRLVTEADLTDLDWVKPYLDEARESLARGEGITLQEFNAHVDERLKKLR